MDAKKKALLEKNGWRVGEAADFLELSPEESALVEIRLALSRQLKSRRSAKMTQTELAQKIGSSQPRVAMAERGSRAISLDLMVRALVATGATSQDIGRAIAGS